MMVFQKVVIYMKTYGGIAMDIETDLTAALIKIPVYNNSSQIIWIIISL